MKCNSKACRRKVQVTDQMLERDAQSKQKQSMQIKCNKIATLLHIKPDMSVFNTTYYTELYSRDNENTSSLNKIYQKYCSFNQSKKKRKSNFFIHNFIVIFAMLELIATMILILCVTNHSTLREQRKRRNREKRR